MALSLFLIEFEWSVQCRSYVQFYEVNIICFVLKGHLQPVCIAIMHFTALNKEITKEITVFDNRDCIYVSFKKGITACYCLRLWRYNPIFKYNRNVRNFCILQQMISVKCTIAMHTGWRCPCKKTVPQLFCHGGIMISLKFKIFYSH